MASTIPAAIDAVVELVTAEMPADGCVVFDGPPVGADDALEYVAIGMRSSPEEYVVTGGQQPAGIGNLRRSENYTINCQLAATDGDSVMKTARDRAFTLLAVVETALRPAGDLDNTVLFGDLGTVWLQQLQTTQGALAIVDFTVEVKFTRI